MDLYKFKELEVGDTVYLPNTDTYTVIVGIDYQFSRVLTIDGIIVKMKDIEEKSYLVKQKQMNRLLLSADIGVLETRINNLIDSGDESKMSLIKDLFLLKKDKEKELTLI